MGYGPCGLITGSVLLMPKKQSLSLTCSRSRVPAEKGPARERNCSWPWSGSLQGLVRKVPCDGLMGGHSTTTSLVVGIRMVHILALGADMKTYEPTSQRVRSAWRTVRRARSFSMELI